MTPVPMVQYVPAAHLHPIPVASGVELLAHVTHCKPAGSKNLSPLPEHLGFVAATPFVQSPSTWTLGLTLHAHIRQTVRRKWGQHHREKGGARARDAAAFLVSFFF